MPIAAPGSPAGPRRRPRLHVVTGKGGTGKTTVAAALALALAERGRRVLLAEVEQRQALAPVLGCSPVGDHERLVQTTPAGGELYALAVDPRAALMEYLRLYYRLGPAGALLDQVGAVEFATDIAPGLADVLVMGKLYEATRRTPAHQRPRGAPDHYDQVVVDAPPTGRVVRFLEANTQVADLAKVGPIRHQADAVTTLVHSDQVVVHLVTLLEEMPVAETVEAVAQLREAGLHPGMVVVDQVRDDGLSEGDLDVFDAVVDDRVGASQVADALRRAGAPDPDALAAGLVAHARDHAARLEAEGAQQELLDPLGLPTVLLPHLPAGVGPRGLRELARSVAEQVGEDL
ncbi:ArsA-related P-loop ATPase [Arsenicicoccus sp. oral taxon 190]|uniref:ArsA-related P-loop ATPase n=1 Tax=Arsenicicoccus sp. oral taxon 190 TaxID=1658671 RepID=UPI00067A329B|nr:ArsA-related P-loop ATPase [Arsenicicoccus sp. oral taxon 190]AKT50471.1 hypothetical protein ADJ73_02565 [Arsenicicoccus sp. oral taxon 190]